MNRELVAQFIESDALTSPPACCIQGGYDFADGPRLRTLVNQHLEDILQSVVPTDYVEDCLFQIDEALERLCTSPQESLTLQVYLLGAIEELPPIPWRTL